MLLGGGAEQAPCNGSHDHEMSAIVDLAPMVSDDTPSQEALAQYAAGVCRDAFPGYVGRAVDSPMYETFAAVPTADGWAAGSHTGICLVARRDGQWMTHPARGSGESKRPTSVAGPATDGPGRHRSLAAGA